MTLHLTCTGGPCSGVVRLSAHGYTGHARYSIAAGKTATLKIKLTRHRRALRIRSRRITVTLVIAPAAGTAQRHALKLNVYS